MPVSTESSLSGPYTPNGATTDFAFDFKAVNANEVVALNQDGGLIPTALYSVTLDDDEGGTLSFSVAPSLADYTQIYVAGDPALTQPSDFDNAGPSFNPASLTRALDRSAIRDLKLQRDLERTIKVPFDEVGLDLPGASARSNRYFGFDNTGALELLSPPEIAYGTDVPVVATPVGIAALTGQSSGDKVYFSKPNRAGWFEWFSTDQSLGVSLDPLQGVYFAPASDPTGASGAWRRVERNFLDIRWFTAANGTDSTDAINAALALGGTIVVPPGTYYVSLTSGVGVRIEKSETRLLLLAGSRLTLADGEYGSGINGDIVQIGDGNTPLSKISIEGPGLIDGNVANQATSVSTTGRAAVRVHGPVTDCNVTGVRIADHAGVAILVDGTAGQTAQRIRIDGNFLDTVGEGILWTRSEYVTVKNNHIYNVFEAQDAIEPYGLTAKYWVVEGNTINTVAGSAMDIFAGASFGTVKNNTMVNASTGGTPCVFINGNAGSTRCVSIVFEGNVIDGTNQIGINVDQYCDDVAVLGNDVKGTNGVCIAVADGATAVQVKGNNCRVDTVTSPAIQYLTDGGHVCGNICNDGPNVGIQIGSAVSSCTSTIIEGNTCVGNTADGILSYATRSTFEGNLCRNNNSAGNNNISGIRHISGDGNIFRGNDCFDDQGVPTQDWGIYIAAGSKNMLIGNMTRGNDKGHVLDTGTDTIRKSNTAPSDYRKTKPDGATTMNIAGVEVLELNDTAPTTITGFTGGHKGQKVRIEALAANSTLEHGNATNVGTNGTLKIPGGANKSTDANDTLFLFMESATSGRIAAS